MKPKHAFRYTGVMHDTYFAALTLARIAFEDLNEVLAAVPDEALDWTPAAGTNSLPVLARHVISATAFLSASASGLGPDREKYVKGDRATAFKAKGVTGAALQAEVTAFADEVGLLLARGTDATLAAKMPWPMADGRNWCGAELLIHTIGHLREHVGQAELMRDLWLAKAAS